MNTFGIAAINLIEFHWSNIEKITGRLSYLEIREGIYKKTNENTTILSLEQFLYKLSEELNPNDWNKNYWNDEMENRIIGLFNPDK